jgi:hypothetical protein
MPKISIGTCCASCEYWKRSYSNNKMCRYGVCKKEFSELRNSDMLDYQVCTDWSQSRDARRIRELKT